MRKYLKHIMRIFGYDILHLPTNPTERKHLDLFKENNINLIFDIGANTGQFGSKIRKLGYKSKIVSFEPMKEAFLELQSNAKNDSLWETVNSGIANEEGFTEINISSNSYSSSILEMLPLHIESLPNSAYVRKEIIYLQRLDNIIEKQHSVGDNIYVKIDTQGYEKSVLESCANSFSKIRGFQLELSIQPLYKGETLMLELIHLLKKEGYVLKLLESGHQNYETGEILQLEGYFFR